MASPMSEESALALFNSIKQSEYRWVVAQWDAEMAIKTRSHSSNRKSVWDIDENPRDIRANEPILSTSEAHAGEVEVSSPTISPNEDPHDNTPSNNQPVDPQSPSEPVTVPSIK